MVGVLTLASVYILGGLTFLPLCVAAFLACLFYTSPVVSLPNKTGVTASTLPKGDDDAEPVTVYRAGWLVARRTYEPTKDNGDGTYVGMLTSSYKSFMDNRSKDPRRARPKDRFYAVLKHKTLYLYEGEDQTECWAAIELPSHDVVITPEGYLDGELFAKRTAIELRPKEADAVVESLLDKADPTPEDNNEERRPPSWFIFARVNSDKEDWYHSLVLASRLGSPTAAADVARDRSLFDAQDMARLVEVIDQQPDSIPMRWFNALLGRVFLAVYRTKSVEEYITSRIVRKLKRVKLPAMLSEIQVREVQVGASVPLFSKPMLKDLNAEGDASMETHVAYVGNARVTIETVATISLGSRFKPYTVRLVLAVVLKELEGTMLFKVKKPPSNRIWFGFTQMPKMVLSVEPVVSTRQIKWSLVTGPIESRIRELVRPPVPKRWICAQMIDNRIPFRGPPGQVMEALVLPHMDDVAFFNTSSAPFSRGGIYGDFLRDPEPTPEEELNGPKREDREATHEDLGEEDFVGGVGGGEGEAASSPAIGTSTATAVSKDNAAGLRPTAAFRRRRSSEGDHPQSSPDAVASKAAPEPTRKPKKAASSTSSLAGLGASFAQWREQAKTGSTSSASASGASSNGGNGRGGGTARVDNTLPSAAPARKSTWFGNSTRSTSSNLTNSNGPASASASAPNLITRTPSVLSVASTETTASASDDRDPARDRDRGREEVSAAKLRDILSKRAESRERERRREREVERARELEADKVVAQVGRVGVVENSAAPRTHEDSPSIGPSETEEACSEAEPAGADDGGDSADTSEPAFTDLHRTESAPAHLDEVAPNEGSEAPSLVSSPMAETGQTLPSASRQDRSAEQKAPALPSRPTWVKPHSPTPSEDTISVKSSVAPSTDLAAPGPSSSSSPPPPPSHPRHAGSASVDSGGATLSASASTLLSTWRTRAADKEALAAGVASAKESMRRWGANWAAKRAAQKDRGEDFDKVVGESPDKPRDGSADRYREHRRERESRDSAAAAAGTAGSVPSGHGPAGGYFGGLDAEMSKPLPIAPKTPPRGRAGSSAAAAAAAAVEPPASSTSSPSTSRLVPSASTPSLALSPSTATAEGSPSTSPAKPSHMMMQVPPSSSVATSAMSAAGGSHAGGYGTASSSGMSAYGRRTMAVPGIRDGDRKKKVAEDHLGSTAVLSAARTPAVAVSAPLEVAASSAEQSEAIKVPTTESSTSPAASPSPSSDPPPSVSLPRSPPPPLPVRHVSNESVHSTETTEATPQAGTTATATVTAKAEYAPPPLPARAAPASELEPSTLSSPPSTSRPALPARPSHGHTPAQSRSQEEEEDAEKRRLEDASKPSVASSAS